MGKKYKKTVKKSKIKEPVTLYKKGEIRVFHSFEEANEYDLNSVLQQTPLQRIKETVELILRIYGISRAELKKRAPGNSIKLIRYE